MAHNLKPPHSVAPRFLQGWLWFVARHEAAHFVAAVYYGFPIWGVYLPVRKRRDGLQGRVVLGGDEDIKWGGLVVTAAGTMFDHKELGMPRCRGDAGFLHELRMLRDGVRRAAQYRWHEIYLEGRTPSKAEVDEVVMAACLEAKDLIERYDPVITEVARYMLANRNKATGLVHLKKIQALESLTRRMIERAGRDERVRGVGVG